MSQLRTRRSFASIVLAGIALAHISQHIRAQATQPTTAPSNEITQAYLREHYTKYEYKIPMRDGVKLFTAVYAPKDDAKLYPILLTRTPYGLKPCGVDLYPEPRGPLQDYAKERFIFVLQDVRGRSSSEGQFVHV